MKDKTSSEDNCNTFPYKRIHENVEYKKVRSTLHREQES